MFKKYPALALPIFLTLWISISFLFSLLSGWSNLAKYYSASDTFQGDKWYLQSVLFGLSSYKSAVTVGANHKSIYLAVIFPFRMGHPPLEIPYHRLRGKETQWFFLDLVRLRVKTRHMPTIFISKKLAERIEIASGKSWRYKRR